MRLEDIPQVIGIDRLSSPLPWSERSFRFELTENNNACVLVADASFSSGQRVLGVVVLWLVVDEIHVATIGIHPDYRRKQIARVLLFEGLCRLLAKGAVCATLEVRRSNLAAQALYQSFEFEVVGCRKRYYKDNHEDALIMTTATFNNDYISRMTARIAPAVHQKEIVFQMEHEPAIVAENPELRSEVRR
jgi:ribosomal-protein-alanine N-acetyltransferase